MLSFVTFCPSHCLRWHSDPFWGEITFETHNVETHNLTMRILKEKLTWHEITVISSHPALVERWRGSFDDCGRAWAQNKWLFNGNSLTVESTCFKSWLVANTKIQKHSSFMSRSESNKAVTYDVPNQQDNTNCILQQRFGICIIVICGTFFITIIIILLT